MLVISLITLPISADDSPSRRMLSVARAASETAIEATCAASAALREISRIDRPISSEPAATLCTLREISSASAAAEELCRSVLSTAEAISAETAASSVDAVASESESLAMVVIDSRSLSRVRSRPCAMVPSSSRDVMPLRSVRSPLSSASITLPILRIGLRIERTIGIAMPISSARPTSMTTIAVQRVDVIALSMSAFSVAIWASTISVTASSSSSVLLFISGISSIRPSTDFGLATPSSTNFLMNVLKASKSPE